VLTVKVERKKASNQ